MELSTIKMPQNNQINPTESTPPPPSQPPITPPRKPKALLVILALTTLLSLSAAGYLYYQNYSLIASPPIIETPPITNGPQPSIESTDSWLSYALGNYQFKLPPHLTPETQYDDFFFASSTEVNDLKVNLDLGAGIGFQCIEKITTENISVLNKTVMLETYQGMKPDTSIACDTDTSNHFILMARLSDTNPDQPETLIVSFETPAYSLDQAKALMTQILSTFQYNQPISGNSSCPQGFEPVDNTLFSVCIPIGLTTSLSNSPYYADSTKMAFAFTAENANMSLTIQNGFVGGWGGSPCLQSKSLTVNSYPSEQVNWAEEIDGECSNNYPQFTLLVNYPDHNDFPFPYYVGLRALKDPFPDTDVFDTIVQTINFY